MTGVLDRKHCVVRLSLHDLVHGILPCFHMAERRLRSEALSCREMGIRTLDALINDALSTLRNRIELLETRMEGLAMCRQNTELSASRNRHHLLIELPDRLPVEIRIEIGLYGIQLLRLPYWIKYRFAGFDLILCHLFAEVHPLLIKLCNLVIQYIELVTNL